MSIVTMCYRLFHNGNGFMIHGYHIILPAYGFWLPNDPRGSWSKMVRKWELVRFGPATRSLDRLSLEDLTSIERAQREEARQSLRYMPVTFSGVQARSIDVGFSLKVASSGYTVWACSILPEHTHLVLARHRYKVEQIVNLLKGAATSQLIRDGIHPLAEYENGRGRPPRMWAEHQWKVYLDNEDAIENAIRYVKENPIKEGKPQQSWSFVTPFRGVDHGGWQTYH